MGDQIGQAITGELYYIPKKQFENLNLLSKQARTEIFANMCRINTLYMIAKAGSGHIGSSFSSLDMMSWLELNELKNESREEDNIFFSSKGHDAPGLYSIWLATGKLDFNLIHKLRKIDGLPGHPDVSTPNVVTNTGSLGMGISKAKGMIIANRINGVEKKIYVLTGDGELQEGQLWESLISASNNNFHELTVIVDHNKLQSDTLVSRVSDLGNIESKFKSFGWEVIRCDGNDMKSFSDSLRVLKAANNRPKVIIADTIKGKGVSFMEHTSIDSDVEFYKYHSGAPDSNSYYLALDELITKTNNLLAANKLSNLELEKTFQPETKKINSDQEKLIQAYSQTLINASIKNDKIVALDADLILDTGLIPFKDKFPDRFIECGIAEQDMVSQAGGMALMGLLPIVHSFSCFLSTRPNEQMYNNATEKTKIIYVGSLAGILPGGPGHSHQAVRDISTISGIPGLIMVEPSCEEEVHLIFNWAIDENKSSTYLRLVSIPYQINFKLPKNYTPKLGNGITLKEGKEIVIISYGPIMLTLAMEASEKIYTKYKISAKIINLPWLNYINSTWLVNELKDTSICISIDNHFKIGGQGDRIADIIASSKLDVILKKLNLDGIPSSGTNLEIMQRHDFTVNKILDMLERDFKND